MRGKSLLWGQDKKRERDNHMKQYSNYTTRESSKNLYRAQNKSVLVAMVWLIGITALVLGGLVLAGQLGLF